MSLLGALGCGAQLLQLLIEELETGDKYDFLVLQATDNAIGFYEKMGFTRVGAISKPDEEAVAAQHAEAQVPEPHPCCCQPSQPVAASLLMSAKEPYYR